MKIAVIGLGLWGGGGLYGVVAQITLVCEWDVVYQAVTIQEVLPSKAFFGEGNKCKMCESR